MKKAKLIFGTVFLSLIILSSCVGKTNNKEGNTNDSTLLLSDTNNIKNENDDVKSEASKNNVVCTETQEKTEGSEDPRIIQTSIWKNYKSESIGQADYKGRYGYTYKLYKFTNNKYIEIENSELFNSKRTELLKIINQKIKRDFDDYSKDPENQDCFDGISCPNYTYSDLNIIFIESGILFNASYGLSGACMAVDEASVMLEWNEIEKYVNDL